MSRLFFIIIVTFHTNAFAQIITTVAGNGTATFNGNNIFATNAGIAYVTKAVFDTAGNYYFTARQLNMVRKVDKNGIITTIAGTGIAGYNGDNILATLAQLNNPIWVAIDKDANIYIADLENYRIRKVSATTGVITTIAGNGVNTYYGDSILAVSASLHTAVSVSVDKTGNVYLSEQGNPRIRKIDTSGIIRTIAGTGIAGYNGDNIPATSAQLGIEIWGHAFDSVGNIYIADMANGRVRKIDKNTNIITTVAGNGNIGYNGDSIIAINASINGPTDIAFSSSFDMYVADKSNNRIRRVNANTGIISSVAGNGINTFLGDNGQATSASIYFPYGVTFDNCDNMYIADNQNKRIRKVWFNTDTLPQVNIAITPNDTVTTGTTVTTSATATNHGTVTSYQWVKNGVTAGTSSTYTYTPVNGDSVYCIVTVRACTGRTYTDTTQVLHITVTGDAGITSTTKSTIQTYPNPVTDVLHVATTEPKHYMLHNLMGIAILQGTVDNHNSIDMKAIPAGIYLLQLTNAEGQREVVRVVKE